MRHHPTTRRGRILLAHARAFLAQSSPSADALELVSRYGLPMLALAIVVWASARGLIRWGPGVRDTNDALQAQITELRARVEVAEQRAQQVEGERRDLDRFLRNEAVPALTRTADALSKAVSVIDRVERERR